MTNKRVGDAAIADFLEGCPPPTPFRLLYPSLPSFCAILLAWEFLSLPTPPLSAPLSSFLLPRRAAPIDDAFAFAFQPSRAAAG